MELKRLRQAGLRIACSIGSAGAMALIAAAFVLLGRGSGLTALAFVLTILCAATWWGMAEAVSAAIAAAALLVDDWIDLAAFLPTATLASDLPARAKRSANEAIARQRELEVSNYQLPLNGVLTEFPIPTPNCQPRAIALGADGNLWFVELSRNGVARITTAGKVTEFQIPSLTGSPINIAVGPDRNIWYTKQNKLGRVTPDGMIAEFEIPTPNGGATGLTSGSDRQPPDRLTNKLWFTETGGNKIAFLNFRN